MNTLRFAMMAFALTMLSAALSSCDKDDFLTVENTAGNLESQIGNLKNVSTLKISGPLNGDDIYYLREILVPESCKVSTLDLSDASIVEGGMAYSTDFGTKYYTSKDEIGIAMFMWCKFTTVILPNTLTSIGNSAFWECSNLVNVTMGNHVSSIDIDAFAFCSKLSEINIPDSVVSIGDATFVDCSSLAEVTIPNSVTSIGEKTFQGCTNLTDVTIGKAVGSIGNYAFSECTSLKRIILPGSLTEIREYAFNGCISLTEIAIPDCVTSIGNRAFYGCTGLYTLIIGGGMTTIGDYAFDDCDRLYDLYCYANTPPSIGSKTFTKANTFLYVPKGSLEAYETAWGKYFTNISEMN